MATDTQPLGDDDCNGELTERQQKILAFIREFMERRRYPPSMREIAHAVGLKSASTVSYQLKILEKMGCLTRDAGMPRTVVGKPPRPQVLQEIFEVADVAPTRTGSQNMVSVPLFERIAAGDPALADPNPQDIMQLPLDRVGSGVLFAVRVAGDSMINVNIFNGDCVVVRKRDAADNGDIVAAWIQDGDDARVTVKTFYCVDGHVWLMPQNPGYKPIPGDHYKILGKVIATVHRI
jgi:repressor LexA